MMTTQIPYTIQCQYPGFETFAVTYNMLASQEEIDAMIASIGDAEPCVSNVVMDMHGWPEEAYPGGPFSSKAPVLLAVWVLRLAFQKAMVEYVTNPT